MVAQPSVRIATLADTIDEETLVARVQGGDAAAFETMFLRYCEPLCVFVARYVGSQDVAEDIVQGLFCRLWEQRASWHPAAGVRAYLFGAARNRALNARRDARGEGADALLTLAAPERSDETIDATELARAVDHAVAGLAPRCREAFRLHREAGLSYVEIASVMGISVKTVGVQMGRAIAALRRRLAPWTRPGM